MTFLENSPMQCDYAWAEKDKTFFTLSLRTYLGYDIHLHGWNTVYFGKGFWNQIRILGLRHVWQRTESISIDSLFTLYW